MFPTLLSLRSKLPYSQPFKKAALGLFHGKTRMTGNSIPFSYHKTRRSWLPNSHNKRLYSELLGVRVKTTVTARALRTIDKLGGLDNYLLKTKAEFLGYEGMRLRMLVLDKQKAVAAAQPLS